MIGAIIGDIAGSRYEFDNRKSMDIELFATDSMPTDDSYMTIAIAKSLLEYNGDLDALSNLVVDNMRKIGRKYPHAGYGGHFAKWLKCDDPKPYNSYGNGAGMRVSPVAYVGKSLDEVMDLSEAVTRVTHNHLEGLKGAEAIAVSTYLAIHRQGISDIREYVESNYYDLNFTIDGIRDEYEFRVDSMGSVPVAVEAFLESSSFEDAIRRAISVGGDSDTIACMTGSIAEPYFKVPKAMNDTAREYLDRDMLDIVDAFEDKYGKNII